MSASGASVEILEWFRANKTMISGAIKDLFPFLYDLRDKGRISEEDFKNYQDKVASNPNAIRKVVYEVLESIKTNVSAVMEIFSKENLEEYQDLQPLYKTLEIVVQQGWSRSATEPGSKNVLQSNMNISASSVKQEVSDSSYLPLSGAPLSSYFCLPLCEAPSTTAKPINFADAGTSAVYEGQKCAGETKKSTVKMTQGLSNACGKMKDFLTGKKVESKKKNLSIQGPTLIVVCGQIKGVLYKEKLAAGVSQKCIKGLDGKWYTPQEFEVEGGREHFKCWRRSIRCCGFPLETLIKRGDLPDPAQNPTKKMKSDCGVCEVCMEEGAQLKCSSCFKSFHNSCHVPEEAEKRMWICTFCKWRNSLSFEEDQVLKWKMASKIKICEYLLLKTWCEPESVIFADKPMMQTFDNCFSQPVWLKLIKEKLSRKEYETVGDFVRDMRQMFSNFQGQTVGEDGRKVQNAFEKHFQEAFSIRK